MEFSDFMDTLDDGDVSRRLADELGQVVRAARRTAQPGELNIKLTLKPDGRTVVTHVAITTKIPTAKANTTTFYDAEDGELSRMDPRQLPLRNVTARPATPLRVARPPGEGDLAVSNTNPPEEK
jgi:hypothetical protein